jgi:hypothetical protein
MRRHLLLHPAARLRYGATHDALALRLLLALALTLRAALAVGRTVLAPAALRLTLALSPRRLAALRSLALTLSLRLTLSLWLGLALRPAWGPVRLVAGNRIIPGWLVLALLARCVSWFVWFQFLVPFCGHA